MHACHSPLHQVECCLNKWATGKPVDIDFTTTAYQHVYKAHFMTLVAVEQAGKARGTQYLKDWQKLLACHAR
jgi:hypothetical protein